MRSCFVLACFSFDEFLFNQMKQKTSLNPGRRGRLATVAESPVAYRSQGLVRRCVLGQGPSRGIQLDRSAAARLPFAELESLRELLDLPMDRLAAHLGFRGRRCTAQGVRLSRHRRVGSGDPLRPAARSCRFGLESLLRRPGLARFSAGGSWRGRATGVCRNGGRRARSRGLARPHRVRRLRMKRTVWRIVKAKYADSAFAGKGLRGGGTLELPRSMARLHQRQFVARRPRTARSPSILRCRSAGSRFPANSMSGSSSPSP